MGTILAFEDLSPMAPGLTEPMADIIIADIEGKALIKAPCIMEPDFPDNYRASAKAVLRRAALRWARAGEGGVTSETLSSGPFSHTQSVDSRTTAEDRLWPSEVRELQELCKLWKGTSANRRKAFTIMPGR